jgi:hypothetical protein
VADDQRAVANGGIGVPILRITMVLISILMIAVVAHDVLRARTPTRRRSHGPRSPAGRW